MDFACCIMLPASKCAWVVGKNLNTSQTEVTVFVNGIFCGDTEEIERHGKALCKRMQLQNVIVYHYKTRLDSVLSRGPLHIGQMVCKTLESSGPQEKDFRDLISHLSPSFGKIRIVAHSKGTAFVDNVATRLPIDLQKKLTLIGVGGIRLFHGPHFSKAINIWSKHDWAIWSHEQFCGNPLKKVVRHLLGATESNCTCKLITYLRLLGGNNRAQHIARLFRYAEIIGSVRISLLNTKLSHSFTDYLKAALISPNETIKVQKKLLYAIGQLLPATKPSRTCPRFGILREKQTVGFSQAIA